MSDKSYRACLTLIGLFSAIVLITGIVMSILPHFTRTEAPASAPAQELINETLPPIVDTSYAESFDGIIDTISLLRHRYPTLIKLRTAGYSENGREIFGVELGRGSQKALVTGAIHAREHLTTKYLLKVIEDYCLAYESENPYYGGYNIKELLDKYTLYIIPCANPDGLEIIRGRQAVKEGVRLSGLSEYKANATGTDLNRNFPLAWEYIDNGVTSPADYYFKGYKPESAAETKVLTSLCLNNDFAFLISVHIKGNCIFWGDTYNTDYNELYKAFARDICDASGLNMTEPTQKPKDFGGGFENWFRHTFNKPGVCIELMSPELTVEPCGNENYRNFSKTVNYEESSKALAAAMASTNK